jgi:DNA-binding transcriptional regulator of glucitol operon
MQTLQALLHIALAALLFVVILHGVPMLIERMLEGGVNFKQRGMVLLGRSYKGYAAGTIVQLSTQEETALIAQNLATNSAGPVTSGAVSTTAQSGRVSIAAGQSSVVVTHPQVDANSKILAYVNQAAADGTLLRVERIVPAAGSFTIYGTANATAAVTIDWCLLMISGELPPQP